MRFFVIDLQSVAAQHHVQAFRPEARAVLRKFVQSPAYGSIIRLHRLVTDRRAVDRQGPACAPFAWAHHFFPSASRRIVLSSVRSATTVFSRRFSSRSCLSSRSSLTSKPV